MGSIEVREGMEAVERILAHRAPQLAVVKASASLLKEFGVDYGRRKADYSVSQRSVFEEVKQAIGGSEGNQLNPDAKAVQRELNGLAELERLGGFALAGGLVAYIAWKYFQRRLFFRKLSIARIPVEELRRMLDAGEEVVVIDVRGGLSTEDGPIPRALRIPLNELAARHKEIPRDRDIVLFCT